MSRHRRQIQLCVPDDPSRFAHCEACIQERLRLHAGIRRVGIVRDESGVTVELDYDPAVVTLAEIEREINAAQGCLHPNLGTLIVPVPGMISARAEHLINATLNKLPGVVANASYATRNVRIEFDRRQCPMIDIMRRMEEIGYPADFRHAAPAGAAGGAADTTRGAASAAAGRPTGDKTHRLAAGWNSLFAHPELGFAILGGILLLAGFLVHVLHGPNWVRVALLAGAYIASGRYTGLEAWETIRRFNFNIDVLMFAAAFGAAAIGHYEEGALLLFLFALGNAGEHLALERARKAINSLANLAPDVATLITPDGERTVAVEELKVADRVIVRPFERVPADGEVAEGASAVDQASITGESIPVEKVAGDGVFAGTINGEGRLVVSVSKTASQSTLAKIIKLVEEAQTTKSPTQLFTDSIEKWYVPVVLIGTAALIVAPPLVAGGWQAWFYRSMGFLTAASPCALAIGTPAAILCGIARSARMGVLMKGGVHLENLGRVRAVCFDKTGTLTTGHPTVTDIVPLDGRSEEDLLAWVAALERESNHPLAASIVNEAKARGLSLPTADEIEQIPGQGMRGRVNGVRVAAGHAGMLGESQRSEPMIAAKIDGLTRAGKTLVVVLVDGEPAGLLALADRPRPEASAALDRLRRLGIAKTIMLTGDHRQAAAEIGRQVGVDEVFAELLPEEKLGLIRQQTEKYGRVAMIGDGVNDAPALAYASVGIAMGGASADVAMETADVVLMSSDLNQLPDAIALSRQSRRTIVQNLCIALGVIGIMAPAAALGFVSLGIAVLFHEGSTVVVVLNSLRLLGFKAGGGVAVARRPEPSPVGKESKEGKEAKLQGVGLN